MTYAGLLLYFVVPAIALAALQARRAIDRRFVLTVGGLLGVVFAATYPWDTRALAWGIWRFDEGKICGARLGLVPVEECAFFGLQTVLVALLYRALSARAR